MLDATTPATRPVNPRFSSGPCAKIPHFSLDMLAGAPLGRSHRAAVGKAKLAQAIDLTREVLGVPADYRIGIVPASDTGAVEMALWSLLGPRGVDMVAWESFGSGWVSDVVKELKLPDTRKITADYGLLPDLSTIDFDRDVVFTWNGTTSGVRVPNADWIPADRKGLTICDATSAAFAQRLDFAKLDVVTFSWQKVLGGEAAHGMIILSPRAVERLTSYVPAWPLPKIFRMTSGGKLIEGIFVGETINTPSMLCNEDYIDALKWAKGLGGLDALVARAVAPFGLVVAAATTAAAMAAFVFFFLFVLARFLLKQGLTVGDGDLIIVRVDFGEGEEPVPVAAIFDEGRLKGRFDPCDLGEIDIAAERFPGRGFEVEFLDPITAEHHHPSLLGMGSIDQHLVWH